MAYTFAKKVPPTEPGELDLFGNVRVDGAHRGIGGNGNGIQTTDATGTPQISPLAGVTTSGSAIQIPLNAGTITISSTVATLVSEVAGFSATGAFLIPANTVVTLNVGYQATIYVASVATTASIYFMFGII